MAEKDKYIGASKSYFIWTILALSAIAFLAYMINSGKNVFSPNPDEKNITPSATITQAVVTQPMQKEEDVTELKITDIKEGNGASAVSGKTLTVNYRGALTSGTQFDSSYDRGQPFVFKLGVGGVIQGWDKGVVGMKVGGKRKLVIPPDLGYGSRGAGASIPPNATLVFEIELLKVE